VGAAAYITTFIGLMGVVLAVSPIVGQLFGAKKLHEAGYQMHQAMWLALALAVPGCLLLLFPWPFLALAGTTPEVEAKVQAYLATLAFSLPASLLILGLPRLQHRRLAAQGRDGAADGRAGLEGAAVGPVPERIDGHRPARHWA
jgi:Na+-driven multidrug efflux pump